MEKILKFNKGKALNKDVGLGKKSKINKRMAYVYSGLEYYRNYKCIFFTGAQTGLQVHALHITNFRALFMLFLKKLQKKTKMNFSKMRFLVKIC